MDSYELFTKIIYKYISFPLSMLKSNLTDPNFKRHRGTTVLMSAMTMYLLCIVRTIFTYPVETALQAAIFGCFASQGIIKLHTLIPNSVRIIRYIEYFKSVYVANLDLNANCVFLAKCARWNLSVGKMLIVTLSATLGSLLVMPILFYMLNGEVLPMMPVFIPFVDEKAVSGYIVHAVFHFIMVFVAYFGTIGSDLLLVTFALHIWPLTKIFDGAVNNLNSATCGRRCEAVKLSIWLRTTVRNLLLMHAEYSEYLKDYAAMLYRVSTVELYSNEQAMILLVYSTLVLKWVPGIFLFGTVFFKLLVFCFIGTFVEMMNDNMYNAIANIDTVMLPQSQQKLILFMIRAAQSPYYMKAGLRRLNLSTFVEVIKNVYTLAMLLLESV